VGKRVPLWPTYLQPLFSGGRLPCYLEVLLHPSQKLNQIYVSPFLPAWRGAPTNGVGWRQTTLSVEETKADGGRAGRDDITCFPASVRATPAEILPLCLSQSTLTAGITTNCVATGVPAAQTWSSCTQTWLYGAFAPLLRASATVKKIDVTLLPSLLPRRAQQAPLCAASSRTAPDLYHRLLCAFCDCIVRREQPGIVIFARILVAAVADNEHRCCRCACQPGAYRRLTSTDAHCSKGRTT